MNIHKIYRSGSTPFPTGEGLGMGLWGLALLFLFLSMFSFAQSSDTLTLEKCYDAAIKAQPLNQNAALYAKLGELNLSSIGKTWFPTITVNGQATWQSDVTKFDLQLPPQLASSVDFPSPNKDQYKVTMEIKQTLYDGGLAKNRKQLESKERFVDIFQIATDVSKVKETISALYFSCMLTIQLIQQFEAFDIPLQLRRTVLESAVANGIALPTDIDAIDAERLSIKQKIEESKIAKESALNLLRMLTNDSSIKLSTIFKNPDFVINDSNSIKRSELLLMDLQKQKLDATIGMLKSSRTPKIFAFSTLGYGNPGLNMFKTGWKPYGIVGLGFSWNVIDWGKTSRDKQTIGIQKSIIDTRKQDISRNIQVALENKKAEIDKMVSQIENDEQLVLLRSKITRVITKQVEQGTATNYDFINQMTKENDARTVLNIHRVQLQKLMAEYSLIMEN